MRRDAVAAGRPLDGADDGGHAGGVATARAVERRRSALRELGAGVAAVRLQAAGGGADVGGEPVGGGAALARPGAASSARSAGSPSPVRGRTTGSTGVPDRPSLSSSRRRSARQAVRAVSASSRSTWLSDDEQHPGVPGVRREVAVVDRGVGVLLRVEHPHQDVDELDQPVDLEPVLDGRVLSWSGRSSSTSPSSAGSGCAT